MIDALSVVFGMTVSFRSRANANERSHIVLCVHVDMPSPAPLLAR
jgi:hypothetical protein